MIINTKYITAAFIDEEKKLRITLRGGEVYTITLDKWEDMLIFLGNMNEAKAWKDIIRKEIDKLTNTTNN